MTTLTFDEYQTFTDTTSVYNTDVYAFVPNEQGDKEGIHMPWSYPVHALAEEAGEVSGKIAKFIRKHGNDTLELRQMVALELGDVLFQVARVAREFELSLENVASMNVDKLKSRQERNVLLGDGDNR